MAAGILSEKSIPSPTASGLVISNSTPLALTLLVKAEYSLSPAEITTGRFRGNRTAQRTSWLGEWLSTTAAFFIKSPIKIVFPISSGPSLSGHLLRQTLRSHDSEIPRHESSHTSNRLYVGYLTQAGVLKASVSLQPLPGEERRRGA